MTFAYIFCGPSIENSLIEQTLASTSICIKVLPPARQGDILRLISNNPPKIIGLIDGFFFQQPAVHYKEILLALEKGILVFGAASMGALRAAELSYYGMEGIGEIYEMYANGKLDGDDEVAVLHAEHKDQYRSISDALVNIRVNVSRAQRAEILDQTTANAILNAAKELHFTERTYRKINTMLESSSNSLHDVMALRRFNNFLKHSGIDQKQEDSVSLITTLISRAETHTSSSGKPLSIVPRTTFLRSFEHKYSGRWHGDSYIADFRVWSFKKLFATGFEATWIKHSLRCLAIDEAKERNFQQPSHQTLVKEFQINVGLITISELERWLGDNKMNFQELKVWLLERWLVNELKKWYSEQSEKALGYTSYADWLTHTVGARLGIRPNHVLERPLVWPGVVWEEPMLREEKANGDFVKAIELASKVYSYNRQIEQQVPGIFSRLGEIGLQNWFASSWRVRPENMNIAVRKRGFNTMPEFFEVARVGFLFDALREKPLRNFEVYP